MEKAGVVNITAFRKEGTAIRHIAFTVGKVYAFHSLLDVLKVGIGGADEP